MTFDKKRLVYWKYFCLVILQFRSIIQNNVYVSQRGEFFTFVSCPGRNFSRHRRVDNDKSTVVRLVVRNIDPITVASSFSRAHSLFRLSTITLYRATR